jgi:outer membrane protein insertion porin family
VLPVFEKYFLGGIETLRGFEFASVSPRDPETDDKIGGERMMVYNLEYRFPLFKEHGISGLVFLDTGNSYTKDQGYDFGDMRESVGTGVRWFSPVGPIRLEYGFILDPRDDEPSGNWEVAFGGSFW